MLIPIIGIVTALGVGYLIKRSLANPGITPVAGNSLSSATGVHSLAGAPGPTSLTALTMVPVQLPNGQIWEVTNDYISGPVGINQAASIVKNLGLELPSASLVDAIWRQADLKLVPLPRNNIISQAVFDDQAAKIAAQKVGKRFTLVAGQFKDVISNNGHPEIYGWHVDVEHGATVPGVPLLNPVTAGPGKIIQPMSGAAHDLPGPVGFIDYAEGVRGVRRIS